jgi:hypothetical protein
MGDIYPEHITYVRDDIDISRNSRMYHGTIVRVPREVLNMAYEKITAITDEHLRIGITNGVSHRFHYRRGVYAFVYGPENGEGIRHIKVHYNLILPLLEVLHASGLPVPEPK